MSIQVGYGSDRRGSMKKGLYGTRTSGKLMLNGGFNGAPTVDFHTITDERWNEIFGSDSLLAWKKKLLEENKNLE